jgi:hypothetical protein
MDGLRLVGRVILFVLHALVVAVLVIVVVALGLRVLMPSLFDDLSPALALVVWSIGLGVGVWYAVVRWRRKG